MSGAYRQSLKAASKAELLAALQLELSADPAVLLLLQQGLQQGGYALPESLQVLLLSDEFSAHKRCCRLGLAYHSVMVGCQCADDPSPDERYNEYLEVSLCITRSSAQAQFQVSGE